MDLSKNIAAKNTINCENMETEVVNAVGSAAQTLIKYDKKFGEALKVFFDQLATILSSQ